MNYFITESKNAIFMFNLTHIKNPMTFIKEIEKNNTKVHVETQKITNSQGNTG
jgi:hypothetical protein